MRIKFLLISFMVGSFWCLALKANAQGGKLPLNGSVNGTLATSTTTDTWNLTTTGDGLVRLTFQSTGASNEDLFVTLYDNNGTTVIAGPVESYTNSLVNVPVDGLSQGTYHVKVTAYSSNSVVGTYTLSDSLFTPSQANDIEPNNSRATALTLPLNSSKTGHVGYYYNNYRDSSDWYKVTTNADGLLRVTLSTAHSSVYSNNSLDALVYLYDNDGVTQLGSVEVYNGTTPDTASFNTDGLAAGTYYIKVRMYYPNSEHMAYTLSDSLFTPSQANDIEPNNSRTTALTLPLNGSKTGHVGYYYNNYRDSSDWYKVTTNADGLLRVTLSTANSSAYSNNSLDALVYLYDNDGITQLGSVEVYNGTTPDTASFNTDGLAPGTYYIKVRMYYPNSEYMAYTLSDSLFTPSQANDAEPNNSRATALTLPLNESKTGHVGYYYNNYRDSSDWYKVTTNADGLLRVTLSTAHSSAYSNNSLDALVYLYDNDGVTQLGSVEVYNGTKPDTASFNTDGLAAGTYYIKVRMYYPNSEYMAYTLSDSLFTYNPNDPEPNNGPYQATTIPVNRTITGHIDFYYNHQADSTDWWKINYTGANGGGINFTFNILPHLPNGGLGDVFFQVYSDTTAAPIFNQEFYTTVSTKFTVSSLTQGYYWIKIIPYNYANRNYFTAYSITDSFTQVNIAKIVFLDSTSNNTCGNDQLTFKLSSSHAPYMVRLYKNGKQVDSTTTSAANVTFTGLNAGTYYATAFGDGATGNAFGKSGSIQFLPPYPTGLNTTNITTVAATLNWNLLSCVSSYQVQYRVKGNATWTNVNSNDPSVTLSALISDTLYYWQVRSVDNTDGQNLMSEYSSLDSFRTMAILPVTFINFDGVIQNGKALLSWSTANEINNKGFEVQKSNNGQTFTDIGFVAGHKNSSTVNNYNYTDAKVVSGANYYRLKQIDNNGNFAYSSVIKLDYSAFDWNILGNPVSGNSWIQLQLDKSSEVSIQIVSLNGNIIQTINKGNLSAGTYSIPINLSGKSAGLYVVRLIVDGQFYSKKIVK